VRYSFSGEIRGPREVLDGGYLSWFDQQTRHLFQLQVDGTKAVIVDKGRNPIRGGKSTSVFRQSLGRSARFSNQRRLTLRIDVECRN